MKDDHRMDSYDYLYSRDLLEPWVTEIEKAERKALQGKLESTSPTTPEPKSLGMAFC
jgi:hypothetical protein